MLLYPDHRFSILSGILLACGLIATGLFAFVSLSHYGVTPPLPGSLTFSSNLSVVILRTFPLPIGVASWIAFGGLLFIWRGRTRSMWLKLGFDQDVFRLFIKMRGAPTRLKVLRSLLESPKDRAQIAEELGLDWKAIDRHIEKLERLAVINEKSHHGTTKFYELTPMGNLLLKLVEEMDKEL